MLLALFILFTLIFALEMRTPIKGILRGKSSGRQDNIRERLKHCLGEALLQKKIGERWWGKLHLIIFYTFFIFLLSAIELMIASVWEGWNLSYIFGDTITSIIYIIQTYFAWMCLIAMSVLSVRRFIRRKVLRSTWEAWAILGLISAIMLSHFGVITSRIALGHFPGGSPGMLPFMSYLAGQYNAYDHTQLIVYILSSWIHIICICLFLIQIPRGKHLHILMAFPALYTQYRKYTQGRPVTGIAQTDMAEYEKDLESALEKDLPESEWPVLGAEKLSDLSRRPRLEAYACTQCQRCTDVCPMVSARLPGAAGPMQSMLNLRKLCTKQAENSALIPNMLTESELWDCTLCGACDRACPVGVEHTVRTLALRQVAVCRSAMPDALNRVFSQFERSGNPWGRPKSQNLPVEVSESEESKRDPMILDIHGHRKPVHTLLFFVGCMGHGDPGFNRTIIHTIKYLAALGFEVRLLEDEQCCGEPMRKLGNEAAFMQQLSHNREAIQNTPHDLILTACPHCAQVLGNDYLSEDFAPEVMHCWEFLAVLHKSGIYNPELGGNADHTAVLHVPCLIGKQPRFSKELLKLAQDAQISCGDPDVARAHCCGAGGGQFFMEGTRSLAEQRVNELLTHHPQEIVTACPYCQQMIGDELNRRGLESSPKILNILDRLIT